MHSKNTRKWRAVNSVKSIEFHTPTQGDNSPHFILDYCI